jgi:hypothetical protein
MSARIALLTLDQDARRLLGTDPAAWASRCELRLDGGVPFGQNPRANSGSPNGFIPIQGSAYGRLRHRQHHSP